MAPVVEMESILSEDVPFQNDADVPTSNAILSSDETYDGEDERRFVWFQKEVEQKKLEDLKFAKRMDAKQDEHPAENAKPAFDKKKDFKDKFRAGGGAKGKTGSTDFTKGKSAFVRPCTVGWKSQNQPLMRGGGNRTPRQKG
jgi:hypothetical protein